MQKPSPSNWIRCTIVFFILITSKVFSQTLFYNDQFNGGVTCAGYSPPYYDGGTGSFDVSIESGSTIHKAYLLAGRHGNAPDITVTLNGNDLTFNSTNQASVTFQSPNYGGPSGVHAIDVTDIIDASVTSYTLEIPYESGANDRYNDFYLFIAYDNSSLPAINAALYLNEHDLTDSVSWYIDLPFAWNTSYDAALSIFAGYSCFNGDGESVYVDGTYLGDFYGPEANSGDCGGPLGNFYYQDGTLTGLSDDNADEAITGPDVISNLSDVVSNGGTSTHILFDSQSGISDNAIWAVVIANGGGCTEINLSNNDTTICYGASVQLNVDGGTTFAWSPTNGLSDSTIANPIATPDSTTLYTVSVIDTNGCLSVKSVLITITAHGTAGSDVTICEGDTAQLSASGALAYSWSPTTYLSNPLVANPLCFTPLTTTYTVTMVNPNDCVNADDLVVTVNPVVPPTISQNGNVLTCSSSLSYQWQLDSVDIPGATNQTYTMLASGLYSCEVTTANGCSAESYLLAFLVGVNELNSDFTWDIFPNPATDEIFVTINGLENHFTFRILNSLGQEVIHESQLSNGVSHFDIRELPEGIYLFELTGNKTSYLKKWLKH